MNWLIRKKMKIVYWLNVDWFRRTKRSIIDWMSKIRKKKSTIDSFRWFENALCKFFIQFTKIRLVTSWLFRKTWIENQVKYIHRFQRKNFTFWRFSFDSRIFTSDSTIFFWFAYFYKWSDDFLLICVFLQMIWRFFLTIRVFLRAIIAEFDRITINFVNFVREICCAENVKMISSSSRRIDKKISCWKKNRHELNDRVSFYSLILRMWNLHRSSRWKSNIMSEIVSD